MTRIALLSSLILSLFTLPAFAAEEEISADSNGTLSSPVLEKEPLLPDLQSQSYVSLRMELYQPWGQGVFADQSVANFSNLGSSFLPTLSYGVLSKSSSLGEFQTNYGLEATGSYITQAGTLISNSGLSASAKLESWSASLKPTMRFRWRSKAKVYTRVSGEAGYQQLNLYSAGNLGSLSHSSAFFGYGLGIEWNPLEHYGFTFDYYSRVGTASEQNGWTPAASSYQVGAIFFF